MMVAKCISGVPVEYIVGKAQLICWIKSSIMRLNTISKTGRGKVTHDRKFYHVPIKRDGCFDIKRHLSVGGSPQQGEIVGSKQVLPSSTSLMELLKHISMLETKGYIRTCRVDFFETFLLVARLGIICLIILLVVQYDWVLYQLDVKSAFLYNDLEYVFATTTQI